MNPVAERLGEIGMPEPLALLAARDWDAVVIGAGHNGLTGGNIFQGEITPDQMWQGRLGARTPLPGLYMSGAATHPAGGVIALNGRNAAQAVLADNGAAINSGRS